MRSPRGIHMKAIMLAIVLGLVMLGCSMNVRQPAREATLGAISALDTPPEDAELARKAGLLLDRFLTNALAAGPPPGLEAISANVTQGAMRGLTATVPEQRWIVRHLVSESLRTAVDTVMDERGPINRAAARAGEQAAMGLVRGMNSRENEATSLVGEVSGEMGRSLTRAMGSEMAGWFGPDAEGPLADAMAAAAERAAGAAVRGALAAAKEELAQCPSKAGEPCVNDVVASLSRSAARGASEGFRREFQPLPIGIAFTVGLAAALLGIRLVREWRSRKRPTN
ncbi:hypothetical protein [Polyangium mundeleinium]|uniref:DUF937 domain-containing protein n=1 Tax=Polyangium mundeleinium TaxID=2995306 RepID=A0ABT5F2R1_9BACT|nr:hypothetical protein [Polyangium mundeleinium]MDC0747447.1 hypothetical protein [Polyangium mundeleinium]